MKRGILALLLSACVSVVAHPEELQLRVIATHANIRLEPNLQSQILKLAPLGAIIKSIKKEGEWYLVELPGETEFKVTGYIHQSTVRIFEMPGTGKKSEFEKTGDSIVSNTRIEKPEPKKEIAAEPKKGPEENVKTSKDIDLKSPKLSEREALLLRSDPNFSVWKKKLDKAMEAKSSARELLNIGLVGLAISMGVYVANLFIFESTEVQYVVYASTIGSMAIGLIGFANIGSANGKIEVLNNEGKIKGYLGGVLNPIAKKYGLNFSISF